jgi:hypothetical protein
VAAVIMAGASAVSAGPPAPPDAGDTGAADRVGTTASHYVVSTGETESPDAQGYRGGCADGKAGVSGLRILFFGTQESDGRIRPPGTTRSSPAARVVPDWVAANAIGWMRGFTACGRATAVLALGVNNKVDGGADPAGAGAAWAALVDRVAVAAPAARIQVTGALDGEPSWSPPTWARRWVDAYVHGTRHALYAANSADGCPPDDPKATACSNRWTVADVFHVSTGAAATVAAIPQIYRTDGIQARQWARISGFGVRSGAGPLRVAGVLTQQGACRTQSGCGRTANSADDALGQLTHALDADRATRPAAPLVATDVDWPVPPPPPGSP